MGKTENATILQPERSRAGFDLDELRHLVSKKLLSERRHPEADLSIFNYTPRAQYLGQWTETLLACRGLILDNEGRVVARGFPKFFNFGERPAPRGEDWTATEKYDGSLGILYRLGDQLRIATRGSFTSKQALAATELLAQYELDPAPGSTPLFEIIVPENRIVVDYGSRRELVLLAAVDNQSGADLDLPNFSGPRATELSPEQLGVNRLEELLLRSDDNAEGWVVRFADGQRVKLKLPEYVRRHRIIYGLNAKAIWENLKNGTELEPLLNGVPDEIFTWVQKTRDGLTAEFQRLEEQAEKEFNQLPAQASRRQAAEYFRHHCQSSSSVLFAILDGRDPSELIWQQIKPSGQETPQQAASE